MSYELFVQKLPVGQVATMKGMANLTAAFADGTGELASFLKTGESMKVGELKRDIRKQVETRDLDADLRATLEGILKKLPTAGMVSISSE